MVHLAFFANFTILPPSFLPLPPIIQCSITVLEATLHEGGGAKLWKENRKTFFFKVYHILLTRIVDSGWADCIKKINYWLQWKHWHWHDFIELENVAILAENHLIISSGSSRLALRKTGRHWLLTVYNSNEVDDGHKTTVNNNKSRFHFQLPILIGGNLTGY